MDMVGLCAAGMSAGISSPVCADSEDEKNPETNLSVSPYAIVGIFAKPDIKHQLQPGTVSYDVSATSALNEPVTILKASSELLTRPASAHQGLTLDLSEWEGITLLPSKSVTLSQKIFYDSRFENTVITQNILLRMLMKEKETTIRILSSRCEVVFGDPPKPQRGIWPTTGYITALETYPNGKFHNVWQEEYRGAIATAVDIEAPEGTPVVSPFSGIARTLSSYISPSYGNQITLTTPEGIALTFAHLSKYWNGDSEPGMEKEVKPGDLIGYVGRTGTGAGYPHLHYEVHGINPNSFRENFLRIYRMLPQTPVPYVGMKVSP